MASRRAGTTADRTTVAMVGFDNAGSVAVASSGTPLPVAVTGGGDATAANQTTQITHLVTVAGAVVARSTTPTAGQPAIPTLFIRDDALSAISGEADEGEVTLGRVDANGALWVQLAGALDASVDDVGVQSMTSGAATTAAVGDAATSTTILASADTRKGFSVINTSSAILYIKYGSGATATSSYLAKLAQFERFGDSGVGVYTGIITGIWASDAGGEVIVTSW